jgi:PKHD-type hydroxylase
VVSYNLYDLLATEEPLFTPEECGTIIALYKDRMFEAGKVLSSGITAPLTRDNLIQFVPYDMTGEASWIFERLWAAIAYFNQRFKFDLRGGFHEGFQFAKYEVGHFYNWHADLGADKNALRKLSLIVQLSSPDTYTGGDVHFFPAGWVAPKVQGVALAFPAYIPHRVTPIRWGVRYSLVSWVAGVAPFA